MTPEVLKRAVQLAKFHAMPLEYVHSEHILGLCEGLSAKNLEGFAANPAFAKPINRELSKALNLNRPALNTEDLGALENNHTVQGLSDLVTLPTKAFEQFLSMASAVRLHGAILKCVLKSDREKIRTLFGLSAFNMAVREAPLIYPALNLDLEPAEVFRRNTSAGAVRDVGARFLRGFVNVERPALLQVLDLRLTGSLWGETETPSDVEIVAFRRFLRDRLPQ